MKKKYVLSGTVVAGALAIIALLRDVFDFKLTVGDILAIVQNHAFPWIVVSFLFPVGILIGFKLASQNRNSEVIRVFDLSDAIQSKLFYQELCRSYTEAQSEIFLTGKGFVTWSSQKDDSISDLLNATKIALDKKVSFIRIQISDHPTEEWANAFADIMQNHSNKLKVYADYESTELANTAVIDPNGKSPIVQLLFETEEVGIESKRSEASLALFIYGRRDLARGLQKRFLLRTQKLQRMLPNELRDLGLGLYYFAYGSNISSSQMQKRCPNAKIIGVAVLYDWELDFSVEAPHLRGNAAGIYRASGKYVWGVTYAISKKDKEELDKTEQGGYYPVEVSVKMEDSQHHINQALVYIPAKPKSSSGIKPDSHYVEIVLEGAKEHKIQELVDRIEKVKQDL